MLRDRTIEEAQHLITTRQNDDPPEWGGSFLMYSCARYKGISSNNWIGLIQEHNPVGEMLQIPYSLCLPVDALELLVSNLTLPRSTLLLLNFRSHYQSRLWASSATFRSAEIVSVGSGPACHRRGLNLGLGPILPTILQARGLVERNFGGCGGVARSWQRGGHGLPCDLGLVSVPRH